MGFLKKKINKKTQSGFELGLGFIHTRPEPRPGPDLFKGKILKYPNLYIYKSLKKKPYSPNPISLSRQPSYTHHSPLPLDYSHSPHITLLSPTSDLCHYRPSCAPPVRLFSLFLSISTHTVSHSHSLSISLPFKQRRLRSQPLTAVPSIHPCRSKLSLTLNLIAVLSSHHRSVLYFSSNFF